ncbi:MAG: glycosyltransferase family 4 protein [Solirubrobacteraceae bacterium]
MKIVLVTSLDRGGPIEQSLLLARSLSLGGDSVLVTCANRQLAERFAVDGVRAEVAPLRHQRDLRGAARVWRLVRGADVVHAHDRRAGLWTRIGPRPRRGGARVYTVHGTPEPYHPPPVGPERPGLKATLLYRGLDAGLCVRADAVVVPSQFVARDLVERLGYPAHKLTVIPNGIILPPFVPSKGDLIGTLSLLEPVKGIEIFLRAVVELAPRHPDWRFVMFGDGTSRKQLLTLARELGIEDRVEHPGFVPAADALARMRIFVLSSYRENAPMGLLEAMGAGVPAVATSVAGVPEIADDDVAQMIQPGNPKELALAIERLCNDDAMRDAQIHAARRRVEESFTAERNANAIRSLYQRLLRVAGL